MPCEGGEAVLPANEARLNNIAVPVSTRILKNLRDVRGNQLSDCNNEIISLTKSAKQPVIRPNANLSRPFPTTAPQHDRQPCCAHAFPHGYADLLVTNVQITEALTTIRRLLSGKNRIGVCTPLPWRWQGRATGFCRIPGRPGETTQGAAAAEKIPARH